MAEQECRSTRDQMNWTELDVAYDFAEQHGLRFKMHTMIWGQQQPAWLSSLSVEGHSSYGVKRCHMSRLNRTTKGSRSVM